MNNMPSLPKHLRIKEPNIEYGSLVSGAGRYIARLLVIHDAVRLRGVLGRCSLQDKLNAVMAMPERSRLLLIRRLRKILGIRPLKNVSVNAL